MNEKSPVKWLTDKAYNLLTLSGRAIAWADSQVGVRESGVNKGKAVEAYQEVAGLGTGGGFPWCASFVYWCLIQANGDTRRLPERGKCAAVRNWVAWSNAQLLTSSIAKRGRLFYWLNADGTGHIGWCLGPSVLGIFRTIEGNTDGESGSREGDGVYKRTRTLLALRKKHKFGFIDMEGLE